MWKLFLVAALGLCHFATTEEVYETSECIFNEACMKKDDNTIECDDGLKIDIITVIHLIGEIKEQECNCKNNSNQICSDDSDPDDWEKSCFRKESCSIPELKVTYDEVIEGECFRREPEIGTLQAFASRITYTCNRYDPPQPKHEPDSKMSLVIIAAVVSALVVLAIVLVVFAVVYVYKRKSNKKYEINRNRSMHDAHYHSNGGFDEDYSTIPADYNGGVSSKEHKYYTISDQTNGSIGTDGGKHFTETSDGYDKARHGRPPLPDNSDRNAYSSNGQSSTGTYNKMVFNKTNNENMHVEDYSHLRPQDSDYSHLGDTTENANIVNNDYNRLQRKAGAYDDAISPTNSGDESNVDVDSFKRKGSQENPLKINNATELVTEKMDEVNSDATDSKEEQISEGNQESLPLPSKKTTDESGSSSMADECASLDSYESLPSEDTSQHIESWPRRESFEIPELKASDNMVDSEMDNDSMTENARLDDTSIADSSMRSRDS